MEDLLPTWMEKIYFLFCRIFRKENDDIKEEIKYLLDLAHQLKADKKAGKIGELLLIPAFVRATGN